MFFAPLAGIVCTIIFSLENAGMPVCPPAEDEGATARALSQTLCTALLPLLPQPLYEASPGWGQVRLVRSGFRWQGPPGQRTLEPVRTPQNHGLWRKIRLTALAPDKSFTLDILHLSHSGPERVAFILQAGLDVHLEAEQQRWQSGLRLYAARLEARCRLQLRLEGEVVAEVQPTASVLPDLVLHLRVHQCQLTYDHLVVEHLAGLGGSGARLLGEVLRSSLHRFAPQIERHLEERLQASLVRALEQRPVRLSWQAWFSHR